MLFLAALLVIFAGFPFAWMISTAFKELQEIFATPPSLLPRKFAAPQPAAPVRRDKGAHLPQEQHRRLALDRGATIAGDFLLLESPTRFRFPGREQLAGTILFTYMFAPIMIIVPLTL